MKKLANLLPFGALFILPLLFYPGVSASSWRSNSDVHALIEFASSLLAITAGVMVLLHFFTTGRRFFLIISIGFFLIGAEEFVHALFSFNRIWLETPPTFKLAISSTWLAGNFVLAASFFLALSFGKGGILPANRGRTAVAGNIIGLICAASVTWLIFHSPRLPHFVELGSTSKQLIELSLALLFFGAFLFHANAYLKQPYRSPLLWSIIACIIFRVLAHLFVFDARAFYDSHWDAAHLLVFLSYFFPIFGVWGETIRLHQSAQVQVIELGKAITERSRAEELLGISRENLLLTTEGAKLGVWNWNTVTDELIWSARCKALFGIRPDELISYQRFLDALHPDDREKADMVVKEALDNHKDYDIEYRSLWPDGSLHWLEARGRGYYDATGRATRMEGVVWDIAERKRAEEVLRDREAQLRAVLDATPFPVALVDLADDKISFWSQSAVAIFGHAAPTASEWYQLAYPDPDYQRAVIAQWKPAVERARVSGQSINTGEYRIACGDGSVRICELFVKFLPDTLVVIFNDITVRKQVEAEVRELNRTLEQRVQERTAELRAANEEVEAFAYAVSHDLRAPLRAMNGFSQALLEDHGATLPREARGHLDEIILGSRRMGELIDGLLRLSRGTRGELRRNAVDVSALAGRILGELAAAESKRRVTWTVEPGLTAVGDERMIEVVLTNLLGNAWKYTANTPEAKIEVGRTVAAVSDRRTHEAESTASGQRPPLQASVFFVRDNGAGFDMRHAARLFQPFQRLHREDEFPGIGIGLATVQRILHRHGGTIRAIASPGQGATFSFSLPVPNVNDEEKV